MVDPVKYYAHFAATPVASGPDAGQVAVRPSGVGTTLPPVSASLNGCTTMSTAARADLSDKIVNVVGNLVNTMLNAPLITPTGSAPWPTPISAGLESALQALAAPAATPIDGLTLTPALTAAGLGSDGNGLLLATDSTSTASGVASGAPAQTSSLGFGNAAAAATGGTTPGSASYDLAAGTSLTALNQTLAAGTERGLFNQALTGNGDTGYTFNGLTGDLDLGPTLTTDRPVEVDLTPELAPSVTSAAGPSGSVGVVHVGGLRVSVAFSDTHTPLLTEVVDFDAPAQLGLYGHTMLLTATAPDAGAVHADVVTRATGVGTDAPALVLGWLGPHLVGPLGSGGVPVLTLPALPGVPTVSGWFVPTPAPTLNSVESDRVGDSLYLYLALS
jgi:hypothetical protein